MNDADPGPGMLLVADPGLPDPNFDHTVVLLTHHNDEGTVGIVLNRPSERSLGEVFEWWSEHGDRDDMLRIGGPVQQDRMVVLIHADEEPPDSQRIFGDVWLSGSVETLKKVVAAGIPEDQLRVYAGYSGWAPGQLDAELARDDWVVRPARPADVFGSDEDPLWRGLVDPTPLPKA